MSLTKLTPPFRAEVIGSLLRPRTLKGAAAVVGQGSLTPQEYDALLDREVARVISTQEDIGLKVVTDGEFARTSWFGFFFEGMEGFRLAPSNFKFRDAEGHSFEWPTCVAEKRVRRRAPITLKEYERGQRHAHHSLVKATMPTPSAFHFFRQAGSVDPAAYPDISAYFDDLVSVYRAELGELAGAGCRYVQFDEVPLAMMCDADVCRQAAAEGGDPAVLLETYIELMRRILADRPSGMTIGIHLCRGNFRGRWMAAGGYEPVAEKLFNRMPVDVFFLEYDSDRAGDFQPLRFVPKDKRIVLGLVSTKSARLEEPSDLVRRIDEAARYVPHDQLALSTQCGFASVAGGNSMTEDEQWAKLELVTRTAERVWGSA